MKKIVLALAVTLIISGSGYMGYLTWEKNNYGSNTSSDVSNGRDIIVNKDELKCKDCNLIMISLTNVSAEHMSLYGYKRVTTPNLDKWAQDAIVFEDAFTQSSWTLPVGTSLFTALYPYTHKVLDRRINNSLDKNIKTLPEILRDTGYKTAAFTGGLDYSSKFGHMRGFDSIEQEEGDIAVNMNFKGLDSSLEKATNWINKNYKDKFYLFIHGYDAHCPFDAPEKFKGKFSSEKNKNITIDNNLCLRGYENKKSGNYEANYYRNGQQNIILTKDDVLYLQDLYDEEILYVDEIVSNFLDELDEKIQDKTIVVILSEHGEMFAKHGRFGRAGTIRGTLYDDILHIPLVMKIPGHDKRVIGGLVEIIDVMPTLLDALDIASVPKIQGKNLKDLIINNMQVNNYVFAGSKFGEGAEFVEYKTKSSNESVRDDKWKLIHEIKFSADGESVDEEIWEFYDMENDPEELNNLINKNDKVAYKFKDVLTQWTNDSKDFLTVNPQTEMLSEEFLEEARIRGYW